MISDVEYRIYSQPVYVGGKAIYYLCIFNARDNEITLLVDNKIIINREREYEKTVSLLYIFREIWCIPKM